MKARAWLVGALAVALLTWSVPAQAQRGARTWHVGFLGAETADTNQHFLNAFRDGMRTLGYIEGQTLVVEARWAEGRTERFRELGEELVRLKLDAIVAVSTPAARATKEVTKTIPLVFIAADPLGTGLVTNLAQPGDNMTGLSITFGDEFASKWLQLLREALPRVSRVAVLLNESNPSNVLMLKTVQAAASAGGTVIQPYSVATVEQLDGAFKAMAAARAQGLIVAIDPLIVRHRARIMQLATGHHLPTIAGFSDFAQDGALMTYGSNIPALCRQAAGYVDKILKGARPGDLPVAQATQFEFVINLKTAKTLGVTIPQSLLLRADRVVQ